MLLFRLSREKGPKSRPRCSRVLLLEPLEDRTLPSIFGPPANLNLGNYPDYVAAADFNGDGNQDLAVADANSNDIRILLGNGDSTFKPAMSFPVGNTPNALVVGDFNSDGKSDLVVVNQFSNSVSVLLGNGDGTFQSAVNYAVGSRPIAVVVDDFNGDGTQDLAVTNADSNSVSILLGNGNGTFQQAQTFRAGSEPAFLVSADFNGDGTEDLAVTDVLTNSVTLLLGNGDGSFQVGGTFAVGSNPNMISTADFNGDGFPDLAISNYYGNSVSVLLGNGDGTFQPSAQISVGTHPSSIAVGDFNGDGNPDLVVTNSGSNTVTLLLGNSDGSFRTVEQDAVGAYPNGIAAGDFNSDGAPDLAVANANSNTVSILLNQPVVTQLQMSAPDASVAGASFGVTVTAINNFGHVAASYAGTIHFTSSDPQAILPLDYTFGAADQSTHTFNVTLKTAGSQTVTAADTTLSASASIAVTPAAASRLVVSGYPSPTFTNQAHCFQVAAMDAYGNLATGYLGTVHFTTTDKAAWLPDDYTFTVNDAGIHQFIAIFRQPRVVSLSASDAVNPTIAGTQEGIVVERWQGPQSASEPAAFDPLAIANYFTAAPWEPFEEWSLLVAAKMKHEMWGT